MKFLISLLILGIGLHAEQNLTSSSLTQKQLKEQMDREAKYAVEQRFEMGAEYDLKSREVSPETLEHIKAIEVDDMNMDDVYD